MPPKRKKHRAIFTVFPNLPLELQTAIWELCIPNCHVVPAQMPSPATCYHKTLSSYRRLPHIAGVCREARRVALRRQSQRTPFTIVMPHRNWLLDDSPEPCYKVPFDAGRDIMYINSVVPDKTVDEMPLHEAPHLLRLWPDPDVMVGVQSTILQRSPQLLGDMAHQDRASFYLVLGREFVIHMPRGKAIERGLFGLNADETTVMIKTNNFEDVHPYELAYNMMRRGSKHGDMRFIIAQSQTGWVSKWDGMTFDSLSKIAVQRVVDAWLRLQNDADVDAANGNPLSRTYDGRRMPTPEPAVLFRLCTACRHGET